MSTDVYFKITSFEPGLELIKEKKIRKREKKVPALSSKEERSSYQPEPFLGLTGRSYASSTG